MAVARPLLLLLAAAAPALSSPALSGCKGFECTLAYVAQPDSKFAWGRIGKEQKGQGWTYQVVNITSQRWLEEGEGNPSVWWHNLVVITPHTGLPKPEGWANVVVGRGSTRMKMISESSTDLRAGIQLAMRTGAPTAVLFQVPNQPTVFSSDPARHQRMEEEMRAFSWHKVMENPWAYHDTMELANVKAIVRALDVVGDMKGASRFLVTGFSKRGLATWLAAAVDKRIRAIMPGCHELNLEALLHESQRSYGALPFFAKDYAAEDMMRLSGTPGATALFSMIDSHLFMGRLEGVEKFVMAVTNDDFFTIDNTKNWWDNATHPKVYNLLPNQRHVIQMQEEDLLPSAIAFAQGVLHEKPRPKIAWSSENGVLRAWQDGAPAGLRPKSVRFYSAVTCGHSGRRDFRKLTNYKGRECFGCGFRVQLWGVGGCLMRSSRFDYEEMDTGLSEWVAKVDAPPRGWRAGFFQFEYEGPLGDVPWTMSTTPTVMPLDYPFKDCLGSACSNKLVQMPKS